MELEFKAVAMPCTQQQFELLRPHLEASGKVTIHKDMDNLEFGLNSDFPVLVNDFNNENNVISSSISFFGRSRKAIPYSPIEFLLACGIFPEKWCIKVNEETRKILSKERGYLLKHSKGFVTNNPTPDRLWGLWVIFFPSDHIEITLEHFKKYVLKEDDKPQPSKLEELESRIEELEKRGCTQETNHTFKIELTEREIDIVCNLRDYLIKKDILLYADFTQSILNQVK
jgi:hypothetical protein